VMAMSAALVVLRLGLRPAIIGARLCRRA
jgi:hypothetical protein